MMLSYFISFWKLGTTISSRNYHYYSILLSYTVLFIPSSNQQQQEEQQWHVWGFSLSLYLYIMFLYHHSNIWNNKIGKGFFLCSITKVFHCFCCCYSCHYQHRFHSVIFAKFYISIKSITYE
jgi:hypothetical protein